MKCPTLDVQDFRTCTRLPKPAWQRVEGGTEGAIRYGESWIAPRRWSEVANRNGAEMHSRATWKDVCGPTDEDGNVVDSAAQGWDWPPGTRTWYAPQWTYELFNKLSSKNETVMCGLSGLEVTKRWETYHVLHVWDQQCALYEGPIWSVRNWLVNYQYDNQRAMPCLLWPDTYVVGTNLTITRTRPRWLLINGGGGEDIFVLGSKNLQRRLRRGLEAYEVLGLPKELQEGIVVESRDDTPVPVRVVGGVLGFVLMVIDPDYR